MKSIIENVVKDLRKMEDDRLAEEGCSQTKISYSKHNWLKQAYKDSLKTAISLRMLIEKS